MHVGNDVVDLTDPETSVGATHPRFAQRVLTPVEIATLADATDPNRRLWAYWAAKESAFKAFRKASPWLPFVPRRLRVTLPLLSKGSVAHATVRAGRLAAAVEIETTPDHIHAVARTPVGPHSDPCTGSDEGEGTSGSCLAQINGRDPSAFRVESGVRRLPAVDGVAPFVSVGSGASGCGCPCPGAVSLSDAGRRFLLERLAVCLGCAPEHLRVVPGERRGVPPTVSVHGQRSTIHVSLSHHGSLVAFAFALPAAPVRLSPEEALRAAHLPIVVRPVSRATARLNDPSYLSSSVQNDDDICNEGPFSRMRLSIFSETAFDRLMASGKRQ
jgi:hypothetical protein